MEQSVSVKFPCVHSDDSGEMIEINCFKSDALKGTIKILSGIEEIDAVNIVGASRQGEHHRAAADGVIATISNPNFTGRSYGLALAIADKMARYAPAQGIGAIYATGRIEADSRGLVSAVDGINNKLKLVEGVIKAGDIFLFPKVCEQVDDAVQQKLLKAIRAKFAKCYAISNLCDARDLLWVIEHSTQEQITKKIPPLPKWRPSRALLPPLALITLLLGVYFTFHDGDDTQLIADSNSEILLQDSHPKTDDEFDTFKPVTIPTDAY